MRENPFRTHHASPSSSPTLKPIKSGNNLTKAAFSSFFRLNKAQGWFCLVPYTFQVSQAVKDVGAREIDTVGVQREWKLDLPVSQIFLPKFSLKSLQAAKAPWSPLDLVLQSLWPRHPSALPSTPVRCARSKRISNKNGPNGPNSRTQALKDLWIADLLNKPLTKLNSSSNYQQEQRLTFGGI